MPQTSLQILHDALVERGKARRCIRHVTCQRELGAKDAIGRGCGTLEQMRRAEVRTSQDMC